MRLLEIIIVIIALAFQLYSIFFGYDGETAERILKSNGYTEISTGDHSMFSCPDDFYATKFTAKSPNGTKVKGVVCSGLLFKDNTIRFD